MRTRGTAALALLISLGLASCGAGLSSKAWTLDGGRPDRGYTDCGETTCKPGYYCSDPTFSACSAGCVSEENCEAGLECSVQKGAGYGVCATPVPGAHESDVCAQAGKCEGEVYYCYFGKPADTSGTCRLPCSTSFDCGQAGLYSYDCCPLTGVSASVCVPYAIAPTDGSCR